MSALCFPPSFNTSLAALARGSLLRSLSLAYAVSRRAIFWPAPSASLAALLCPFLGRKFAFQLRRRVRNHGPLAFRHVRGNRKSKVVPANFDPFAQCARGWNKKKGARLPFWGGHGSRDLFESGGGRDTSTFIGLLRVCAWAIARKARGRVGQGRASRGTLASLIGHQPGQGQHPQTA